jgi:hypothetical protein
MSDDSPAMDFQRDPPSSFMKKKSYSNRHFGTSRRIKKGSTASRIGNVKTPWLNGLVGYYRERRATNPDFKYSQAMKEYSKIYNGGGGR